MESWRSSLRKIRYITVNRIPTVASDCVDVLCGSQHIRFNMRHSPLTLDVMCQLESLFHRMYISVAITLVSCSLIN